MSRAGFQVYLSKLWVVDVTKEVRYDLLIYYLKSRGIVILSFWVKPRLFLLLVAGLNCSFIIAYAMLTTFIPSLQSRVKIEHSTAMTFIKNLEEGLPKTIWKTSQQ